MGSTLDVFSRSVGDDDKAESQKRYPGVVERDRSHPKSDQGTETRRVHESGGQSGQVSVTEGWSQTLFRSMNTVGYSGVRENGNNRETELENLEKSVGLHTGAIKEFVGSLRGKSLGNECNKGRNLAKGESVGLLIKGTEEVQKKLTEEKFQEVGPVGYSCIGVENREGQR